MKTEITVLPDEDGKEFTVREGQALPLKEPLKVFISGDIKTVASFLRIRRAKPAAITVEENERAQLLSSNNLQTVDENTAVVYVDKKALTLELQLDPENYYGAVVTGKLEISDELNQFSINKTQTFTKEQLVKLIKFNKLYFVNADKHAEMLKAFQKVSSTVNIKAADSSDERGNKERSYVKEVTTNAPTEFILNIPIFKGFLPLTFRVEIALDVTDGSARFWFESTELHELINGSIDHIFNEELKECEGLVTINK